MHSAIPKNETGRDFVVGDIHGCYDLLMATLSELGFDRRNDRLFSVGDIIDRGPDSKNCLSLLDEPWFYMVLGNHEQMMIDFLSGGQGYGWLREFGDWARRLQSDDLNAYVKKIAKCPVSMTIDGGTFKVAICHAEPDGNDWIATRDNPKSRNPMMWGRRVLKELPRRKLVGVDISIHGHTPTKRPKWVGNRYFLDTDAWLSGILTCRRIDDIYGEYERVRRVFS